MLDDKIQLNIIKQFLIAIVLTFTLGHPLLAKARVYSEAELAKLSTCIVDVTLMETNTIQKKLHNIKLNYVFKVIETINAKEQILENTIIQIKSGFDTRIKCPSVYKYKNGQKYRLYLKKTETGWAFVTPFQGFEIGV